MKNVKLTVQINKPVNEVFAFVINPKNTPTWINYIAVEETNEWPAKVGTTYRNKGENNRWSNYTLIEYDENKIFTLAQNDSDYKVRYTLKPIDRNVTELEYLEWVEEGELESPFTQEVLDKLKNIIEGNLWMRFVFLLSI